MVSWGHLKKRDIIETFFEERNTKYGLEDNGV